MVKSIFTAKFWLIFEDKDSERLYKIDNHIYCVVSGMTSDCNVLLDSARYFSNEFYNAKKSSKLKILVCLWK